jgi:hypothetical protein
VSVHVSALKSDQDDLGTHLNSHAYKCVVGRNAVIVHDLERPVDVCGYNPKGPVKKALRTVSAALLYTDHSNKVAVLVQHQSIHIPSLGQNLLSPNQLRLNDVTVDEQPQFLVDRPTDTTHSIVVPGVESEGKPPLLIPLALNGLIMERVDRRISHFRPP